MMNYEELATRKQMHRQALHGRIPYRHKLCFSLLFCSVLFCFQNGSLFATDSFNWNTNQNRVSADIKSSDLLSLLEQIADATRWRVFVEPETLHKVSAKFENLPPGEALRLLLEQLHV